MKALIDERNGLLAKLKEKIEYMNTYLNDLKPGVVAKLPISNAGVFLVYCRLGDRWQLGVEHEDGNLNPLTDTSIALKIQIVPRMAEILPVIESELRTQVEALRSVASVQNLRPNQQ